MSGYLINISIGPVQPFIAAARRTRDLWFGSRLLSEICMETARSVRENGGVLIFPQKDSLNVSDGRDPNVANVILAELPNGDPKEVVRQAREKALSVLKGYGDQVLGEYGELVNRDFWDDQIEQALEFFSVWVPYDGKSNYKDARDKVGRLMGARKNCRDFYQPGDPDKRQVEKSSLDGRNESVFKDRQLVEKVLKSDISKRLTLRLKSSEQLDALGLIKRVASPIDDSKKTFLSVDDFAASSWIEKAKRLAPEEYGKFEEALSKVKGLLQGEAAFPSRILELQDEMKEDLSEIKECREKLAKKIGEPNPYFAILKADGDKMGAAISSINDPEGHRVFSSDLAGFANEAHKILNKKDKERVIKRCIYAGGDDVLAFLPLDSCIECAKALAEAFEKSFEKSRGYFPSDRAPSLSVGIAVGHFLEPLEDLLRFADEAETLAKEPDRNGLAVVVRSRGNAPIAFRERWDQYRGGSPVDVRLRCWAELFEDETISSRFPYELRSMVDFYRNWKDSKILEKAIPADIKRVLGKKRFPDGTLKPMDEVLEKRIESVTSVEKLESLVSELLIARHLGTGQEEDRS
ncbi:CRISPR-associated protein, Crm2 family [Dethiosulfovibrio peptidovorans DSM 11002]|uniref:CRISPR-associated protein, Crm2 family n=1 Tax=Dethiosulfovibrio peptidovorans DSM 11002 TaxID=469381 RepID=D2Z4K1_9BACT|nr:type III-B CRISPR-associated protein Cas10/Cmr2 [Dethiosulfovibrio peptidovorans]EFC90530.1 CRISPR-associated protein, Crm2 family [Dethiosulfovibrio peptidovorans DSM 11002]